MRGTRIVEFALVLTIFVIVSFAIYQWVSPNRGAVYQDGKLLCVGKVQVYEYTPTNVQCDDGKRFTVLSGTLEVRSVQEQK